MTDCRNDGRSFIYIFECRCQRLAIIYWACFVYWKKSFVFMTTSADLTAYLLL